MGKPNAGRFGYDAEQAAKYASEYFARRGENSAPDVYATQYPKRTRVVEEGEEARGPKRPRRPRMPEGAYKQTATRERREPEEERERKIRKCAVVPVGSEALKRMEERQ